MWVCFQFAKSVGFFVHICQSFHSLALHTSSMDMDSTLSSAHHSSRNIFHSVELDCVVGQFYVALINWMGCFGQKTLTFNRYASISIIWSRTQRLLFFSLASRRYWPSPVSLFVAIVFLIVYTFSILCLALRLLNQLKQCTHVINEEIPKFVVCWMSIAVELQTKWEIAQTSKISKRSYNTLDIWVS